MGWLDFLKKDQPEEKAIASHDYINLFSDSVTPNPSDLVGRKGLNVYAKMAKDDQIKNALSFKKHAVFSTGFAIERPEGVDPYIADFVDWNISEALDGSLYHSIFEMLSALEYGFSVTEKLFKSVESGDYSGLIQIANLKTRDPVTMGFDVDPYGNIDTIKQDQGGYNDWVDLPRDKFVVYSYDSHFSNPYGTSDLEAAYPAWWSKVNAYKWLAIYLEKFAIPPIVALYNQNEYNTAQQNKLKTFLKRVQASTMGILPRSSKDGLELWSPAFQTNVLQLFIPALRMYNEDMGRALLMPGLIGSTPDADAVGSFARAKVHFESFMLVIDRLRAEVEDTIMHEQVIKPLVDLNFSDVQVYPKFSFLPVTDDKREAYLKIWGELLEIGAVKTRELDEQHIRDVLEFPEATENDELDNPIIEPEEDPSPDIEPDIDDEQDVGEDFAEFALSRQPNKYEQKLDFAAITTELDKHEEENRASYLAALNLIKSSVLKKITAQYEKDSIDLAKDITLGRIKPLKDSCRATLDGAFELGRASTTRELTGEFRELPGVRVRDAERWLAAQSLQISGVLESDLLNAIKQIILNGIKIGEGTLAIRTRIEALSAE